MNRSLACAEVARPPYSSSGSARWRVLDPGVGVEPAQQPLVEPPPRAITVGERVGDLLPAGSGARAGRRGPTGSACCCASRWRSRSVGRPAGGATSRRPSPASRAVMRPSAEPDLDQVVEDPLVARRPRGSRRRRPAASRAEPRGDAGVPQVPAPAAGAPRPRCRRAGGAGSPGRERRGRGPAGERCRSRPRSRCPRRSSG